jgi:hypothetical protein
MNIFKRLFGKKEKPVDKDELRRKKQREYYQKNREKLLAKSKEYYNEHRQEISERIKQYRRDNLEKVRKYEREKAKRYYDAKRRK